MRTLQEIDACGKTVLVRVDFNMPLVHGRFTDLSRLTKALPTIRFLREMGAKVVLMSHFGDPKGRVRIDLSLAPVVDQLASELGTQVQFSVDCLGTTTTKQVKGLCNGDVLLLENLRFHEEEEKCDDEFARSLANLGDYYVNEAFSCSHRRHASIVKVPLLLPSAIGFLMQYELESLQQHLVHAKRTLTTVVGGLKVSTKLGLLRSLVAKSDCIVVGGAMANTFLKALGHNIGCSMYEPDMLCKAQEVLEYAQRQGCTVRIPLDVITQSAGSSCYRVKMIEQVEDGDRILDVGPKFLSDVTYQFSKSKTVVWNGPVGAFEQTPFDIGTVTLARSLALFTSSGSKQDGIISVIGGGDIVSAISQSGLAENFTYVSTGGGAFLEWLEDGTLPGIEALASTQQTRL